MLRSIFAVLAMGVAALAWPALASDRSDVIATVQGFNAASARGDRSGWGRYCTPDAVVVDHVRPFVFRGPTACLDEWDADIAWGQQTGFDVMGMTQVLEAPKQVLIDGDSAYAVFPGWARARQHGRWTTETLIATFALRRQGRDWRIVSATWSSLGFKPAAAAGHKP